MDDDEFNIEALSKQKSDREARDREAARKAAQGDAELEAILLETKKVQQETLTSTQASVKTIKQTIAVADRTNEKLTAQGEQLERIADTAQRADENADESYKHAKDLRKYDGFIPISIKNVFSGKKKEQDAKLAATRKEYESSKDFGIDKKGDVSPAQQTIAPGPKKQYADETEREIDSNLDEISAGLVHLKASGLSMQQKIQEQEKTMEFISKTADHTDYTINSAGKKIKKYE